MSDSTVAPRPRVATRAWLLDVVEGNRPPGLLGYPVLAAVLLLLAGVLDPVNVRLLDTMLIYSIAAIGLNVTLGYCGLVSVAQAGFFGVGAYAWMLLSDRVHMDSLLASLISTAGCAVLGLVVGALGTRIRTHYFLIVTIGLQVTFTTLAVNQTDLTGGSQGVPIESVMHIGGWEATTPEQILRVVAIVFVIALYFGNRLRRSRQGRGMVALLQSSQGAEASGVNVARYRAYGMAIGAAYGGLAGSLFAPYLGYLGPDSFGLNLSIQLIVMLVIGGIGSNIGAVVGVVVLTEVSHSTQSTLGLSNLILGLILMCLIIVAPTGIVGLTRAGLLRILRGRLPQPRMRPWPLRPIHVRERPDAGVPLGPLSAVPSDREDGPREGPPARPFISELDGRAGGWTS